MFDGQVDRAILLEPATCPAMEFADFFLPFLLKALAQQVSKQDMVAIPGT
jgi:hypothetical protein